MCGIAGYVGGREAVPVVMDQLARLEYRGYDSAGVAVMTNGAAPPRIQVIKQAGRLVRLREEIGENPPGGRLALAHTRWATHGRPTTPNAHPHADNSGRIAVCHNGIIENHRELRSWLVRQGARFASETDTEVLPHLVAYLRERRSDSSLVGALREALERVEGSYALGLLCSDLPDTLLAARRDSPLVIGIGEGEFFLASDIPAVLPYTRQVIILEDGDLAVLTPDSLLITGRDGARVHRQVTEITWDLAAAEKQGFEHFMRKEIHEQPDALRNTLRGRVEPDRIELPELRPLEEAFETCSRVHVVACGTAYHAGLVAAQCWERWLGVPVVAELASEFRYREPLLTEATPVVLVSQSGETADTLAALREARRRGAPTVAVVNVVGSSLAREADAVVYTHAGPEISVASTKAYTSQLLALALAGLHLARAAARLSDEGVREWSQQLLSLPDLVAETLDCECLVEEIAADWLDCLDFFFLGRGVDYAVAQEGALKLKEISYRHSEALAAGEMKHGTLALVTEEVRAVCLATQGRLLAKSASNLREVEARGARILAIVSADDREVSAVAQDVIRLAPLREELLPILAAVPLQLLAYHVARLAGCEIDRPRNLAKSVTVE